MYARNMFYDLTRSGNVEWQQWCAQMVPELRPNGCPSVCPNCARIVRPNGVPELCPNGCARIFRVPELLCPNFLGCARILFLLIFACKWACPISLGCPKVMCPNFWGVPEFSKKIGHNCSGTLSGTTIRAHRIGARIFVCPYPPTLWVMGRLGVSHCPSHYPWGWPNLPLRIPSHPLFLTLAGIAHRSGTLSCPLL